MKIRTGFVSNSSSSSYIVLLPENMENEQHGEAFNKLITEGEVWAEEVGYDDFDTLQELLQDYIVAQIDSGPDADMITLADRGKIKRILNGK